MYGFIICLLIFATLISPEAFPSEKRVSLREAVEISLKNNHGIRALDNRVLSTKQDIGVATSSLLPNVLFEQTFVRTNNPTNAFSSLLNQERFSQDDLSIDVLNSPDAVNDFQTTLSFEQLVFSPHKYVAITIAKNEYQAQSLHFGRRREELAFTVINTYLSLLTARDFVVVAEGGVKDAEEHYRIAELRVNAKVGLHSDLLRASTSLREAEQRLTTARKNAAVLGRALEILLGSSEPIGVTDDVPMLELRGLDSYTELSRSRNDIASAEYTARNSEMKLKMAQIGYLPTVGVGGSYQLNDHEALFGTEGTSWRVGAFLRWNIFDGGRREFLLAKGKYSKAAAEESLSQLKDSVSLTIYEAYLGVDESKKNLELARDMVMTAEEGRRLVKLRFENSLSPLVDLLDSQLNLDRARAGLIAKRNEYSISLFRLAFESGSLLQELGVEQDIKGDGTDE